MISSSTSGGSTAPAAAAVTAAAAPPADELDKLAVTELTAALRKRGLLTRGNKAGLVERLRSGWSRPPSAKQVALQ